jgi:RNA-splicing ligase RtcB
MENMFELYGKYGTAKVYAETIDNSCISQIYGFLNNPITKDVKVAVMPDANTGKGSTVGFTQEIKDKVNPSMVSVDIGCGMLVLKVSKDFHMDLPKLDKVIHQKIPSGLKHCDKVSPFAKNIDLKELIANVNYNKEILGLSSLGGGNHFIEVDTDENGDYYIVIHSGSRHLGVAVCEYWEKVANDFHKKLAVKKSELLNAGKNEELAKLPEVVTTYGLSYLMGDDLKGYLHDMRITQEFARLNREAMLDVICTEMGIKKRYILDKFCTIHNYIDLNKNILRKGAISLEKDEIAIIPISMAYGSLIVKGKGNPDWNYSGPHGAGRLLSRSDAKNSISMADYKKAMEGIYTTSVNSSTIDESPMAYKNAEEIIRNIADTAEVIDIIKPIYNFKASSD